MPFNWRINIKPQPDGPATFEFEQEPDVRVGDHIIWRNDDTVPHFPTPVDPKESFMSNKIAAQSSSSAFAPSKAGTIEYKCELHEGEGGVIKVGSAPGEGSVT